MKKRIFLLFLILTFGISAFVFLNQAFALDPKLKAKAHDVKVLEIRSKEGIDSIWDLRDNPKLSDVIIFNVSASNLESAQIDILDNWVQNGGCLWLKKLFPIGHKWKFAHVFATLEHTGDYVFGFGGATRKVEVNSKRLYLENKNELYILPHPITTGVKKISTYRGVKAIEQNFDSETRIVLQYRGIIRSGTYGGREKKWIVPFGTDDFEYLAKNRESSLFPILVEKAYGKGKVLFGSCNIDERSSDGERFWFNLKEWGAGYSVPDSVSN